MSDKIKIIFPAKFKDVIKKIIFYIKRKIRKYECLFLQNKNNKAMHAVAILCVKKTVYCQLAIDNANSLHYLNPSYNFVFYCDNLCASYLRKKIKSFDYSKLVEIKDIFGAGELPWQKYKIETLIDASRHGYVLTDADGIWHEEPVIVSDNINILAVAYKVGDNREEILLVEKLFNHPEWLNFSHYVTGFVYIPANFMTEQIAVDLRNFVSVILDSNLDFIEAGKRNELKRLAEELAVNFALQSNCVAEQIVVLKEQDGPGSNQKLQSLYYGCVNQINL